MPQNLVIIEYILIKDIMKRVMDNTGGRIHFVEGSAVRIIDSLGRVSKEEYQVKSSRSDRKGQVLVQCQGAEVKVHYKRVIPVESTDKAICVESAGKNVASCPDCSYIAEVGSNYEEFVCPDHGPKSILWVGIKPMVSKQQKPKKVKVTVNKVIKRKEDQKGMKKASINLDDLAKLADCELYTLKNVEFDHARVEVNSHTLLYTGQNPRKLCFNTYNGNLGKKSAELPIAEFLADKSENKRWYAVKDLQKAREQLEKNGYERR